MYNRHVFYHPLGGDTAKDPLIFGEGRDPQDWPNVTLSNDARWLSIIVAQGWTKTELFLQDVQTGAPAIRISTGKDFLYFAEPYDGDLYILTNEDGPHFRVFKTPVTAPAREHWREIIPQSDAVLSSLHIIGGQTFRPLRVERALRWLKRFTTDGKPLGEVELPTLGTIVNIGGEYDSTSAFYVFTSFTVPATIYRFDIQTAKSTLWDSVPTGIDTNQVRDPAGVVHLEGRHSGADVPCPAQGTEAHRPQPGHADRLWRLQRQPDAGIQQGAVSVAGSRRRVRHGQPARRLRIR